jgi:CIC family chloride channel protein
MTGGTERSTASEPLGPAAGRVVGRVVAAVAAFLVGFVVALCVGRMVVWVEWLLDRPGPHQWWWSLLPVVGVVGALVLVAAARITPATADAYVQGLQRNRLEISPAPVRFLALASGVGTGVPLGYEGPMVYFGGSVGAFVARRLRCPERWVVLAAATSAVAMVIGAPIAAALFASEIARRGLPRRADVAPLAVGAAASWLALRLTGEAGGLVGTDLGLRLSQVAIGAVAIGGAAGLAARLFVVAIRRAKMVARPLRPRLVVAVVVLGVAGPVTWWAAGDGILFGSGQRLREWALATPQPALLAGWLAFVATVVVLVGCGVVGGLFLPLLSIGAVLGVLVGRAWLPDVPYQACLGIGACCMLAAAYGTPLTAAALAVATFGATPLAWTTWVGIVLASVVAGPSSVSVLQEPSLRDVRAGLHRPVGSTPRRG